METHCCDVRGQSPARMAVWLVRHGDEWFAVPKASRDQNLGLDIRHPSPPAEGPGRRRRSLWKDGTVGDGQHGYVYHCVRF